MCLDTITKTGLNKSGYGWKVFDVHDGVLFSEFYNNNEGNNKQAVAVNKWMEAIKRNMQGGNDYLSGFHIFLTEECAVNWAIAPYQVVTKVKYRKGHTIGTLHSTYNVVVSDEMLVLPEGVQ